MAVPLGLCTICGGDDLHAGEDGLFYCCACGSQSQQFQEQALDVDETLMAVSVMRTRRTHAPGDPHPLLHPQEGSQPCHAVHPSQSKVHQPIDPKEAMDRAAGIIRQSYIEGLQDILQMQCEAVVQKLRVTPLVCGIVGPIWLRFLALSQIFEKDWAKEAIEVEEAREDEKRRKKPRQGRRKDVQGTKVRKMQLKESLQDLRTSHGSMASLVWLAALKKRIPLAVTLALLYLACHIAREAILPTDIVKWAQEGNLPYLAAFCQISEKSGHVLPIDARSMFRPANVTSARKLEFMAASIAKRVGLQLPPVNFQAISCRLMEQLKLPVERLSVYVCRFVDWYTPSGLWLSDDIHAIPSRVYVMAMVMIVLKILYKINGQGYCEKAILSSEESHEGVNNAACRKINGERSKAAGQMANEAMTELGSIESVTPKALDFDIHEEEKMMNVRELCPASEAFGDTDDTRSGMLLLQELEKSWQEQKIQHFDYEKDLTTYLKYCQDVIFSGLKLQNEEERMSERLWGLYEQALETETFDVKKEPYSLERLGKPAFSNVSRDSQASVSASVKGGKSNVEESTGISNFLSTTTNQEATEKRKKNDLKYQQAGGERTHMRTLEEIVDDMEEFGFSYLPPSINMVPSDQYLRYVRKEAKGTSSQRFLHADYFILLCACAQVISVEPMALYWCVQRVENGLKWIDGKVKNVIHTEVQKLRDA